MEQFSTPKAEFKLERFNIPKFSYKEPEARFVNLDVQFAPSGIYNPVNGEFKLSIEFTATASTQDEKQEYTDVVKAYSESYFIIDSKPSFENIPAYFFPNSIAIIYPYLRAFASNVTLQAGGRLMVLPVLNLNSLAEALKKESKSLNPV